MQNNANSVIRIVGVSTKVLYIALCERKDLLDFNCLIYLYLSTYLGGFMLTIIYFCIVFTFIRSTNDEKRTSLL